VQAPVIARVAVDYLRRRAFFQARRAKRSYAPSGNSPTLAHAAPTIERGPGHAAHASNLTHKGMTQRQMQIGQSSDIRLDVSHDLQRWRAFLIVAELGSLTRAAIRLDTNQSMLSRTINGLERDCNSRLFNRTGRGVELSEAGARLLPTVRALLHDAEQLEEMVSQGAQSPMGQVTIGLLPSLTPSIIPSLFARVRQTLPKVHLRILEGSSGQIDEWRTDARLDIAILYRYAPVAQETEHELAVVDSYLIGAAGDPLTQQPELDFRALDGLPFILPGSPNGLRNSLDALARAEKIVVAPVIEADSLPLMKLIVAAERLYTVLPLHAVRSEIAEGRLQASRIVNPRLARKIMMATAKTKSPGRAVMQIEALIMQIVAGISGDSEWNHR
jgi:LysR family transcriptional regulator, nitrogen assimilation regulatory protein